MFENAIELFMELWTRNAKRKKNDEFHFAEGRGVRAQTRSGRERQDHPAQRPHRGLRDHVSQTTKVRFGAIFFITLYLYFMLHKSRKAMTKYLVSSDFGIFHLTRTSGARFNWKKNPHESQIWKGDMHQLLLHEFLYCNFLTWSSWGFFINWIGPLVILHRGINCPVCFSHPLLWVRTQRDWRYNSMPGSRFSAECHGLWPGNWVYLKLKKFWINIENLNLAQCLCTRECHQHHRWLWEHIPLLRS